MMNNKKREAIHCVTFFIHLLLLIS